MRSVLAGWHCNAKEASIIAGRSGSITVRYKKGMEAAIVKDEDGKEVFSTASGGKLMSVHRKESVIP